MTRDRLRPAVLARKVLLPPLLAGAVVACLLAALATASGGPRAKAGNPLAPAAARTQARARLVKQFSADLEGTPSATDIRRARRPLSERKRLLAAHPYFRLYKLAKRRFGVPWLLVASIHYQETGFRKGEEVVMAIAAKLKAAGARDLGASAVRAAAARYGTTPEGRLSAAMVVERARAWHLLGTLPLPGRGELATPTRGVVGGCGYFGCPRPGHLHNGIDMLAPTGTPVHAADAGTVAVLESIGQSGGYGNFVCLQHRPHLATCYAHLSAVAAGLRLGARVRRGQIIGLVGSTGSSTAPHLHFEVRRGPAACQGCAVDPAPLLSGDVPQAVVPQMLRLAGALGGQAGATGPRVAVSGPTAPPIGPTPRSRARARRGPRPATAEPPARKAPSAKPAPQPTAERPAAGAPEQAPAQPPGAPEATSASPAPEPPPAPEAPPASPPTEPAPPPAQDGVSGAGGSR